MKPLLQCFALVLSNFLFFSSTLLAQAPANDNCANATWITTDSVCITGTSRLTGQTLSSATSDGGTITSTCTAVNTQDVWYRFVAKTPIPTITVSNLGTSWGTNLKIQLLAGSCGGFTEKGCANNAPLTPTPANALTPGVTYYIRIHKSTATAPTGTNWGFTICVTESLEKGGRMNEVFSQTVLSGSGVLQYPWEITYGPDGFLWITESRGYRLYRMDPNTGVRTTVLNVSQGSTFLPAPSDSLNVQFPGSQNPWPQGGFAGMAIHPLFMDPSNNYKFVYVSYVHRSLGGSAPGGRFFRTKLVRFTYNTGTGLLGSPAVIQQDLPGSNDHNSQRMIIAPVTKGGTNYLFYACGDMGAGQFDNRLRPMNAQVVSSVEGKILRFNLDTVGGAPWIPTDNGYSPTSPVWSVGMRNNQGFAYDTSTNILYGSAHGAYSDDEINVLQKNVNHGHPLIIGYADGNYNGDTTIANQRVSAGAPYVSSSGVSTCPPIGNEANRIPQINAMGNGNYRRPLFTAYATPQSTLLTTWQTNPGNANWLSEGFSGMDLYPNKIIPGWNRSLLVSGLKWGRLLRLKLGTTGLTTLPSNLDSANTADTVVYFQSQNRYRDLAFAPNGKDIFLVMDNNSATSGPGVGNPTVAACPGCVVKYTFLGYNDAAGLSTIPKTIPVADGAANTCTQGTTVTIDGSNNFLWVPITGPDGNIMAEIHAMGQNLGAVTSSFYKNSGAIRVKGSVRYLDRNITITPAVTSFATPVKVRLYISKAEFDQLAADPYSGLGSVLQLKVIKNNDPCEPSMVSTTTTLLTPTNNQLVDLQHGADGYVLQVNVTGFSSFYFASSNATLPVQLLTFTGTLKNNTITNLNWKTSNELNTSHFIVERSVDAQQFSEIGRVTATGNGTAENNYAYDDAEVADLLSQQVYYRLKMFDNNGTYRYSNIIRVTLPGLQNDITISPNPVGSDVNASITAAQACSAEWAIVDNGGRVMLQNTTLLKKGTNTLGIYIGQLASGSYYMTVKGENIDLKIKFQKL